MAYFSILVLDGSELDRMQAQVDFWEKMVRFQTVKSFIHSLEVVNDCVERVVKLITDFKNVIKDAQQQHIF